MNVRNLVQTTATIIKITELKKGNIVKLIEEKYSEPVINFAVVTDILSNGDKTYVELVTYRKDYGEVKLEYKLLSADKDVTLFPATKDDLLGHFETIKMEIQKEIQSEEDKLAKKKASFERLDQILANNAENVTQPMFESSAMPQLVD
jgi:hypothetical protein